MQVLHHSKTQPLTPRNPFFNLLAPTPQGGAPLHLQAFLIKGMVKRLVQTAIMGWVGEENVWSYKFKDTERLNTRMEYKFSREEELGKYSAIRSVEFCTPYVEQDPDDELGYKIIIDACLKDLVLTETIECPLHLPLPFITRSDYEKDPVTKQYLLYLYNWLVWGQRPDPVNLVKLQDTTWGMKASAS